MSMNPISKLIYSMRRLQRCIKRQDIFTNGEDVMIAITFFSLSWSPYIVPNRAKNEFLMFVDVMEKLVIEHYQIKRANNTYWDRLSCSLCMDLSTSSQSEIWISDCFDISTKVFHVLSRLSRFKVKGWKGGISSAQLFVCDGSRLFEVFNFQICYGPETLTNQILYHQGYIYTISMTF